MCLQVVCRRTTQAFADLLVLHLLGAAGFAYYIVRKYGQIIILLVERQHLLTR